MHFSVYIAATGEILRRGSAGTEESCLEQAFGEGEAVYLGETHKDQRIVGGEPVDMLPRPTFFHIFDFAKGEWIDHRSLEEVKLECQGRITGKRWEVENGGITLPNGVQVQTGTADQDRITSVMVNAQLAGIDTVDFKSASGWVTLQISDLKGIAQAIALHVQACFSAERAHHEAVDALTSIPAVLAYDFSEGWPG